MNPHEQQLRRDAAAMVDGIESDLSSTIGQATAAADTVLSMAQELQALIDRLADCLGRLGAPAAGGVVAIEDTNLVGASLMVLVQELRNTAARSVADLETLEHKVVQSVRSNVLGNRRRYARFDVDIPVEAMFAGRVEPARVVNLSLGGAKTDLAINMQVGTAVALRVVGVSTELAGEVVRVTEDGTQIRFVIGDAEATELRRFLEHVAPATASG